MNQPWYYFRLLEPDFTPLPAYGALAELAHRPRQVMPGYFQEDHWALSYSGPWQLVQDDNAVLGAYQRGEPDAELRFSFTGTDLTIVTRASSAVVEARIDQQPVKRLTIASHGPLEQRFHLAGFITAGTHSVSLRVVSGTLHLDGLIVRRVPRGIWLWSAAVVVVLAALLLLTTRCRQRTREHQS